MARKFALLGTIFAAISIALGAFGAHALKSILRPVTPLGGVCFILGWGIWGYQIYRSK